MNISGMVYSYAVKENLKYVDDVFYAIQNPRAPFFNAIKPGKEVTNTRINWWEDVRLPNKSALTAIHVKDSGELVLENAHGVRPNTILKVGGVLYRVLSVVLATGFATVLALSTDSGHIVGTSVAFLNSAELEGSSRKDSDYAQRVERFNVTQIMKEFVDISGTQVAVNRTGDLGGLVNEDTARKLDRIYLQLARSIWINERVEPVDAATPRIFGGILNMIDTYGFAPAATALTLDNLDAYFIELEAERNGLVDQVWMNPSMLKIIAGLIPSAIQTINTDSGTVGFTVKRIITPSGFEVPIYTDQNIPAKKIVSITPDVIQLRPLATRQFHIKDDVSDADAVKKTILGEYTLEINPVSQYGVFTVS